MKKQRHKHPYLHNLKFAVDIVLFVKDQQKSIDMSEELQVVSHASTSNVAETRSYYNKQTESKNRY